MPPLGPFGGGLVSPMNGLSIASRSHERSAVKFWKRPSSAIGLLRTTAARSAGPSASTAACAIRRAVTAIGPAGIEWSSMMTASRPASGSAFVVTSGATSRVHAAALVAARARPGSEMAANAWISRATPSSVMVKSAAVSPVTGRRSRSSTTTSSWTRSTPDWKDDWPCACAWRWGRGSPDVTTTTRTTRSERAVMSNPRERALAGEV